MFVLRPTGGQDESVDHDTEHRFPDCLEKMPPMSLRWLIDLVSGRKSAGNPFLRSFKTLMSNWDARWEEKPHAALAMIHQHIQKKVKDKAINPEEPALPHIREMLRDVGLELE